MDNRFFTPKDNYERNSNMVKHFCSKSLVLVLIILMFVNLASSIYVMFSPNGEFGTLLLNIAFSKFNISLNTDNSSFFPLLNILANGFFTFCFISIYVKSRNEDYDSTPQNGIYALYFLSMGGLALYGLLFFLVLLSVFVVIFTNPESLNLIPDLLKMSAEDIKANKLSIVMIMVAFEVVLLFKLWITQAQADFLKSIKTSLTDSVPKNKGAHTYGTFSIIIGIVLLCYAAVTTFLYYCYKEAFSGLGIKISDLYIFISLVLAYVRGLIPIIIGILAYSYSNIVEDTNTYGTLYTDYGTIGEAVDPNSQRRSFSSSANKFIR